MAKQHMNQYFATIKNRQLPNQVPTGDLIGTRQLLREGKKINRGKMVEHLWKKVASSISALFLF